MKNEGTSRFYVPDAFPAVPDFFLTAALIDTAEAMKADLGYTLHAGLSASDDAFYGESPEWIEKLSKLGLLNVEMEASAIFTVAHVRRLRAAAICAVSGNLVTGEVVYEEENKGLVRGWESEIQVVLEAIHRFETNRKGQ